MKTLRAAPLSSIPSSISRSIQWDVVLYVEVVLSIQNVPRCKVHSKLIDVDLNLYKRVVFS
jgi:hypothetical protein